MRGRIGSFLVNDVVFADELVAFFINEVVFGTNW